MTDASAIADAVTIVERVHQVLGYPTAFLVGPAALLTYRHVRSHRKWGIAYVWTMTPLYALGLWLTFARHELHSEEFRRNLSFNLLGFWLLFLGWRSIWLFQRREPKATKLDLFLVLVLLAASVVLLLVGQGRMKKIAWAGLALCAVDLWELRRGFTPRLTLFMRHVRYMLASYYYVLTVVSIVHLNVLGLRAKWLAPVILGAVVIVATSWGMKREGPTRKLVLRGAVLVTVACAWTMAAYIGWAVATGRLDPFRLSQG